MSNLRKILMKLSILGVLAMSVSVADARPVYPGLPNRAVQYGGDEEFDACSAYVEISGNATFYTKDANGSFRIETIQAGQKAWLCQEEGGFSGVVLQNGRQDCGVSSPVATQQDYRGPCRSGWVSQNAINILAG